MKKLLKKNQKIWIVPEDIKGATSSSIQKTSGNKLEVSICEGDLKYYSANKTIEMFTIVDEGMLYFKPKITEIIENENIIKVEFNKDDYDLLQRREFTRIDFEKEFTLKDENSEHVCQTIDISAGGMKFVTDKLLSLEKDYVIEFSLESNIPIQCFFKPIRIDQVEKTKKNVVSGRFVALKNIDKIAIVQFCFKKQMENTNK